jgi:hypothetical protein
MKLQISKIVFFILFAAISAMAQTSADLQDKYGKPLEAYEVRPNVLLTVEYAKDRQVLEIIIEPRHTKRTGEGRGYSVTGISTLSSKVVDEIVEEIFPLNNRGQLLNSMVIGSGCSQLSSEIYGNVQINRVYTCSETEGEDRLLAVRVRWKKSQ